jgi:hypothetical protein
MTPHKSAREQGKRSGAWGVPCAPNWRLDDLRLVLEVDGEFSAELLRSLHRVRLLADTPRELRSALFSPVARQLGSDPAVDYIPEQLHRALSILGRIPFEAGTLPDREIALACRQVAEWAEGHSHEMTAVFWAEAAASLLPDDAEMANLAGRACRRAGERRRAELWYERGSGLGRRAGNTLEQVNGLLGFGNLYRDFGELGRAFRWIRRAGNTAKRGGLRESAGEALHDAFFLVYLKENLHRAAIWAERAAKVYPVHASRYPYFAADLAVLLARRGLYDESQDILFAVQRILIAPVEQLQLSGLMAFAAGGAGDVAAFEEAMERVFVLARQYAYASAAALAYAAAGAHLLRDWETAEGLIKQSRMNMEDDPLVADLVARVQADIEARRPGIPRPADEDPAFRDLRATAAEVLYRVRRWHGPTWRPPKQ